MASKANKPAVNNQNNKTSTAHKNKNYQAKKSKNFEAVLINGNSQPVVRDTTVDNRITFLKSISNSEKLFFGEPYLSLRFHTKEEAETTINKITTDQSDLGGVQCLYDRRKAVKESGGYDYVAFIGSYYKQNNGQNTVGCGIVLTLREPNRFKTIYITIKIPSEIKQDSYRAEMYGLCYLLTKILVRYHNSKIAVYTSSLFLVNSTANKTALKWVRNGWKTNQGTQVQNLNLLMGILVQTGFFDNNPDVKQSYVNQPNGPKAEKLTAANKVDLYFVPFRESCFDLANEVAEVAALMNNLPEGGWKQGEEFRLFSSIEDIRKFKPSAQLPAPPSINWDSFLTLDPVINNNTGSVSAVNVALQNIDAMQLEEDPFDPSIN